MNILIDISSHLWVVMGSGRNNGHLLSSSSPGVWSGGEPGERDWGWRGCGDKVGNNRGGNTGETQRWWCGERHKKRSITTMRQVIEGRYMEEICHKVVWWGGGGGEYPRCRCGRYNGMVRQRVYNPLNQ